MSFEKAINFIKCPNITRFYQEIKELFNILKEIIISKNTFKTPASQVNSESDISVNYSNVNKFLQITALYKFTDQPGNLQNTMFYNFTFTYIAYSGKNYFNKQNGTHKNPGTKLSNQNRVESVKYAFERNA
ncbi:hypothetical protein BpHYR1_024180 [Brachionus plicatilis]|uniref:Uncharacterized protein n=1 Tax=Brachionus plicatilis TaxID=10195 RepID=A0A3M7SL03_BRAPC|nr:hypothetical protein BpHYR1_024180 [Brachionus plicatilis]